MNRKQMNPNLVPALIKSYANGQNHCQHNRRTHHFLIFLPVRFDHLYLIRLLCFNDHDLFNSLIMNSACRQLAGLQPHQENKQCCNKHNGQTWKYQPTHIANTPPQESKPSNINSRLSGKKIRRGSKSMTIRKMSVKNPAPSFKKFTLLLPSLR